VISVFGTPKTDKNCLEYRFLILNAIALHFLLTEKAFLVVGMMEK
jgi:hypothetical protein